MLREYRGVDASDLPDPGHRHSSGLWALYPGSQARWRWEALDSALGQHRRQVLGLDPFSPFHQYRLLLRFEVAGFYFCLMHASGVELGSAAVMG